MNNNTALITGATSGIGFELAKIHASKGGDLVLVARDKSKLEYVKDLLEKDYKIAIVIINIDLSDTDSANQLYQQTQQQDIQIDILINNAGVGGHGRFYQRQLSEEKAMMNLNMHTLVELTHLYLQDMVNRDSGQILNVSSVASMLPGPLQAVYYASKAFVTSFSLALAQELHKSNISVTVLCPGPVNTDFVRKANLTGLRAFKGARSAESVALCGYKAMQEKKLLVFNDSKLKLLFNFVVPFLPRKLILKISHKTMLKAK